MKALESKLSDLAGFLLFDLLGISAESTLGATVHYFLVTFTVLISLVILVTYLMGTIVSYLPMEKVKSYLEAHRHFGFGNLAASVLGAVTPFCSCSSIPLFVGMIQARMPLGIALSFLITSPGKRNCNCIVLGCLWLESNSGICSFRNSLGCFGRYHSGKAWNGTLHCRVAEKPW